ncbi:VRR-NUC domain-containing protein [Xylophilus sp.]|uniref:VRR-NUC domain-containing protein n=1 Tax=Xylophilus sp. TaxID=2653893 RepID=UPI0013B670F3|nr:VRR-NUC domain-containing protein [Xylophilus sp.]KAF1043470.1 MAG: hypothetical protein GAK38_03967 [Xylophilus sp.]
MRESQVEAYLVERVKALGGEVRKVRWIGRNGAPDRLVMLPEKVVPKWDGVSRPGAICVAEEWRRPPRTIWVELKAPGERPKPHQQREHDRMRRMGQVVVVVDSFEAVDGVLE